jgi:hypothetical protein
VQRVAAWVRSDGRFAHSAQAEDRALDRDANFGDFQWTRQFELDCVGTGLVLDCNSCIPKLSLMTARCIASTRLSVWDKSVSSKLQDSVKVLALSSWPLARRSN